MRFTPGPTQIPILTRGTELRASCTVERTRANAAGVELEEERVTLTELRRRIKVFTGRRPHPSTIHEAELNGLPVEPDPFSAKRRLYPWLRCLQWMKEQRTKSVFGPGVQRAIQVTCKRTEKP